MTAPSAGAGWRLLDTGLRPAADNIALDRILLEGCRDGTAPPTLRFLRFEPAALVGHHQDPRQELDLAFCAAQGLAVQRRLTGGGAILFQPAHLGWEVIAPRSALGGGDMAAVARRLCEAAAGGLRGLGVDARYRPRNDIEVAGRKVGGTGGVCDGEALLYQGTVLVDLDAELMAGALRVPGLKLRDHAVATVRDRVTDLRSLLGAVPEPALLREALAAALGEALGMEAEPAGLSPAESAQLDGMRAEVAADAWVYAVHAPAAAEGEGIHRCAGGTLRAAIRLDRSGRLLREVWLGGDLFIDPPRTLADLEAALRDAPVAELTGRVHDFFTDRAVDSPGLEPDDFVAVLHQAARA